MKRIYLMGSLAMALSLSLFSCTDENSAVGRSVRVHAAAMSVVGVAVETRAAHGSRTKSFEARVG